MLNSPEVYAKTDGPEALDQTSLGLPVRKISQVDICVDQSELDSIAACIERRWLSEGPQAEALGAALRDFTGSRYSVFAPNGTLGLYLAILALDLPKGSEIIIPSFTFYASATSAIFAGLKPVFVDVDPFSFNLDPSALERAITPATRAIMPVHIYGQSCDMEAVEEIARRHDLLVVEDAAQALGVRLNGRHCGTMGDIGVISFFSDKVITMGEGAVLFTQNEKTYERLRLLRNQGRPSAGVFIHPSLGMNFRITDLQAAIGLAQFRKFPSIEAHRLKLWEIYQAGLSAISGLEFMRVRAGSGLVPFRFPFLTERREALEAWLRKNEIETRGFFYPLHLQPCLRAEPPLHLPVSESLYLRGICLPVHQRVLESDAKRVVDTIRSFYATC